ncbi:hypothetical protein E2C01_047397 [Portunus trituberculatus]|uniref:Uncharacterized protein n=1 Tax=Portunus trituberculatus TaxID=210409 RepID=A0A5B7G8F3_PORTR|nr:hypothetical protein [Portunus trituberculatus]
MWQAPPGVWCQLRCKGLEKAPWYLANVEEGGIQAGVMWVLNESWRARSWLTVMASIGIDTLLMAHLTVMKSFFTFINI